MENINIDGFRLRKLKPEHADQVRAMLDTCACKGTQMWNADTNAYPGCMIEYDLHDEAAWGLFDREGLAAYAVLSMDVDDEYSRVSDFDTSVPSATIHRLFTAGRIQRRGVGSRMVRALMDIAREQGAKRMCIDIYGTMPALVRFYTGLGFEKIGVFQRDIPDGDFTLYSCEI